MHDHLLIAPRRNFLVRALGFTMAGATIPIGIIAADDAKARIDHHEAELKKAWQDYYGPSVRSKTDRVPVGTIFPPTVRQGDGRKFGPCYATSIFLLVAGGGEL